MRVAEDSQSKGIHRIIYRLTTPTPKVEGSREPRENRVTRRLLTDFTPVFDRLPLDVGCWKLGVAVLSGDRRSQPVVDLVGGARAGDAAGADHKICIRIDSAAIDVDHPGLADDRFTFAEGQDDAIVARIEGDREAARRGRS